MGNIVVIGPRSSGKTTFLVGLAYWPQRQKALEKGTLFDIEAINEDAKNLFKQAKDIIVPQGRLAGTKIVNLDEIPEYYFRINVKKKLKKSETIDLVVRDSAGELFEDLEADELSPEKQEIMDDFLRSDVVGCLILLSGWQREDDEAYSAMLTQFIDLLDTQGRTEDYRIAIVMSKCERGELWPGRIEPEIDIFGLHLYRTLNVLKRAKIPPKNLHFFATSTFGVLKRNDPRPNRIDEPGKKGSHSVIREPKVWQPFNMIAPLYWLSTGKRINSNV